MARIESTCSRIHSGVDSRWPKLARVIDKGGGQDGAHALGVGAQGQGDAKGDDNGVLAFGCRGHSSSMSPSPVLVEARDLAGIVGRRLVVGHGRRAGVRRPDVVAAWNRRPSGFPEIYGSQFIIRAAFEDHPTRRMIYNFSEPGYLIARLPHPRPCFFSRRSSSAYSATTSFRARAVAGGGE